MTSRRVVAEVTLSGGRTYELAYLEIDERGWLHGSARRFTLTGRRGEQRRSYPSLAWTRLSWPRNIVREVRWIDPEATA